MTVFLNVVAGSLAGISLAAAAKEPLKTALDPSRTRYFAVTAVYAAAALAPAGLATYALYPDWSLMYVANPAQLSAAVMIPVVALACFGAPLLGFFAAQRMIASRRARDLRLTQAILIGVALVVLGLGHGALGRVGYYEAYHYGGEMVPLSRSPVLVALAVIVPVLIVLFGYARRSIQRHIAALAHVDEDGSGRPAPVAGGSSK